MKGILLIVPDYAKLSVYTPIEKRISYIMVKKG